ncbi:MAG: hypothetical protein A3G87_01220 [Omnitrophica bacterium RIFCSPLOWO2_12_FULL_50_11]|nr:MAG: hypothetical protein A3G87_01220 [Omnitrophica bacterium RIFCSPLOWO2_12_FULL_50_11]
MSRNHLSNWKRTFPIGHPEEARRATEGSGDRILRSEVPATKRSGSAAPFGGKFRGVQDDMVPKG